MADVARHLHSRVPREDGNVLEETVLGHPVFQSSISSSNHTVEINGFILAAAVICSRFVDDVC